MCDAPRLWVRDRSGGLPDHRNRRARRALPDFAHARRLGRDEPAPDYSAAYVVLETDSELRGHGMTFTIGRGTEMCVAAIQALVPLVSGAALEDIAADPRGFWREVTGDSHLRWIGPEKGVIHLATAAVVNAVWDLWARSRASRCGSSWPT